MLLKTSQAQQCCSDETGMVPTMADDCQREDEGGCVREKKWVSLPILTSGLGSVKNGEKLVGCGHKAQTKCGCPITFPNLFQQVTEWC